MQNIFEGGLKSNNIIHIWGRINITHQITFLRYVLISFRKRHLIGQNVDTWLRNWNFISQWNSKSFNHAHFQDLCSLIKLQKIAFNSFISHMILSG
jgi:hypothetical protein